MPLPALVLAAGASRRLGQPKQLLNFEGETLLDRSVRLAIEAGAAPVFAVVGAYFAEICESLSSRDATLVCNDEWEEGVSSSIRAGLHAMEAVVKNASGVLIMTCDQPKLTSAHLRAMLQAFEAHDACSVVASAYAGTQGVPAVFPRSTFESLRNLHGDKGARSLFANPSCPMISVEFPGGEIDIDSPADLSQLS